MYILVKFVIKILVGVFVGLGVFFIEAAVDIDEALPWPFELVQSLV